MKVLVIGGSSMVGSRFVELYSSAYTLVAPSDTEVDITNTEKLKEYIEDQNPDVLINFAAFTNVSEAENQRDDKNGLCWRVNVNGLENIISSIDCGHTHLIQISTDMVFPGSKEHPGPYWESELAETDSSKVTWYGFTKGEGERLVRDRGTILRIIYPVRAQYDLKLDYIRKPLNLFDQGKLYPLFNDQQISISFIDEIALALHKIIEKKAKGTFHCCSIDLTTPWELITYLINKTRDERYKPQTSSIDSVENKIRYPKYGGLKTQETQEKLSLKFSSWREIIDKLVEQGIRV